MFHAPRSYLVPSVLVPASIALFADVAGAAIINVPSPQAPTIQVAINIASSGDEIVVAPGTYFEKLNLNGKTITLRSSAGAQSTIIDALGQFDPVIKVISGEGPATIIEGFTIRNGAATDPAPNDRGGGIYCNSTSPTVRLCVFTLNTASAGGAIYANGGTPRFENCQFTANEAGSIGGGAIYLNSATCTLTDCAFTQNVSGDRGGAIHAVGTAVVALRCTFIENHAALHGGAVSHSGGASGTLYDRCHFKFNSAEDLGGGAFTSVTSGMPEWRNCVFDRNHATGNGGGISVWDLSSVVALNCTFAGNITDGGGGGGAIYKEGTATMIARNCVAWGNAPNQFNAAVAANYCNVQGGFAGTGNIGADSVHDPLFANAAAGDYRLLVDSPCIDAGNTPVVPDAIAGDFAGFARVMNTLESGAAGVPVYGYFVDMGAFEFQPIVGPPTNSCPADIAPTGGDGAVNVSDLLQVISAWGACL